VLLADVRGQQLINTLRPAGQKLPMHGNPQLIAQVVASGKATVSDLFTGQLAEQPLIAIGVPVFRDGQVRYVLTASLLPGTLTNLLIQQQLSPDLVSAVLDQAGVIVARNRAAEQLVGLKAADVLLDRIKLSSQGQVEGATLEGRDALFVFNRSAETGWTVYVAVTREHLAQELWQALQWVVLALLLMLLASVGLAWTLSERIIKTLRALSEPAAALGRGEPVRVASLSIREIDDLGKAMVEASGKFAGATADRHKSEARMRGIIESAMDAIVTVDSDQTIVLFNTAASAMFACPVEEALGTKLTAFIPQRFHETHAEFMLKQGQTSDEATVGFTVGLRRSGDEFPVEVSHSSVTEANAVFHTLIIRDVTARMRSYEALERSNLDLQQFAYVASHDLKTPLRSISGFVHLLEKNYADKLDENALNLINRTSQAALRLERLTDDLLAYARVNSESQPFVFVDCNEVLKEVVHLLDAVIRSSGAQLTIGELPPVMGDRTQIVQLFLNLIGNGLKYCQGRLPRIMVSAVRKENMWVVAVRDNGIGIEAKHQERIFEVFKRLHTQSEYPGTGIGLAVCRRVTDRHHGKIWVEANPDQGSTFFFSIPALTVTPTVVALSDKPCEGLGVMHQLASRGPSPLLGEGKSCSSCVAQDLCRNDFKEGP
jgi:PAS domain S-box-containing protein